MTIIGQVAGPVTITGQVDLAFNPFEKRGKHGEWGAGALLKAHDTASATASRDAKAKIAAEKRHWVGEKPKRGSVIPMPDPDGPGIAQVSAADDGHVHVVHADGRSEDIPALFVEHPTSPNAIRDGDLGHFGDIEAGELPRSLDRAKALAELQAGMDLQGKFVPDLARTQHVKYVMFKDNSEDGETLPDNTIAIAPVLLLSSEWKDDALSKGQAGWFAPSDPGISPVVKAESHEMGHVVASYLGVKARTDMTLWSAIAKSLGTTMPASEYRPGAADVSKWFNMNSDVIFQHVSQYAATSQEEMLAELWGEYTTSAHPRPAARLYGDYARANISATRQFAKEHDLLNGYDNGYLLVGEPAPTTLAGTITGQIELSAASRAKAHLTAHDTASATARRDAELRDARGEWSRDGEAEELRAAPAVSPLAALRNPDGSWITGPDKNDTLTAAATGRAARGVRLHDVVLYGKTEPRPDKFGFQQRLVPMEVTALHHHFEGAGKTRGGVSRRHRFTDWTLADPETGQERRESLKDGVSVKMFPREAVRAAVKAEGRGKPAAAPPPAVTPPVPGGFHWPVPPPAPKPAPVAPVMPGGPPPLPPAELYAPFKPVIPPTPPGHFGHVSGSAIRDPKARTAAVAEAQHSLDLQGAFIPMIAKAQILTFSADLAHDTTTGETLPDDSILINPYVAAAVGDVSRKVHGLTPAELQKRDQDPHVPGYDGPWWVPSDPQYSLADTTIAHEEGHVVADDVSHAAMMSPDLWTPLAAAIGADPPGTFRDALNGKPVLDVSAWVRHNLTAITKGVSQYGSSSVAELQAELWGEYTMNARPRPPAKIYGDYVTAQLRKQGNLGNPPPRPGPVAVPEKPEAVAEPVTADLGASTTNLVAGSKTAAYNFLTDHGRHDEEKYLDKHPDAWLLNADDGKTPASYLKKQVSARLGKRMLADKNLDAALRTPAGYAALQEVTGDPGAGDWAGEPDKPAVLRKAASELVRGWASSSFDTDPRGVGMQQAIADHFRLGAAAQQVINTRSTIPKADVDAYLADHRPILDSFISAQYAETQARLKAAGITHVTLYRGMTDRDSTVAPADGSVAAVDATRVPSQPASSWTSDKSTASSYSKGQTGTEAERLGTPLLLQMSVPASRILGTPQSGLGSLMEQEFVVLGQDNGQVLVKSMARQPKPVTLAAGPPPPEISIEALNEDWLRALHWDLPGVAGLPAFLALLHVTGAPRAQQEEAVRHFIALPAWIPAPPPLKAAVSAWLADQAETEAPVTLVTRTGEVLSTSGAAQRQARALEEGGQAIGMAFPSVPGFKGQGWSTQETMMIVRWLFDSPAAWDQAMSTAREYPGNPHTVADTLHEHLVPRSELDAIAAAGGDPARVNWLEIAHELIERRADPLPAQEHAGSISGQLDLAATAAVTPGAMKPPGIPVPDSPAAISMFTAHRVNSILHQLAHATERMQAAKAAAGDLRAYHVTHIAEHLQRALNSGHELTVNIREHYPAEAAELERVKDTVGLAYDPAEARGHAGEWVEMFHGTKALDRAASIKAHGLTAERYGGEHPYNVLTKSKDEAGYFAGAHGAVVTVHVPADKVDEYTRTSPQGLTALKKPLPPSMIHKVESIDTGAELAGTITGQLLDLAKAVSPTAKAVTLAHLLETTLHELTHASLHAQAMGKDTPGGDEWAFDADHCASHLEGAVEHAGKIWEHLHDNYPAEGRWLTGIAEITHPDEAQQHAGTISGQLDLASINGHHVPHTAYTYRHDWKLRLPGGLPLVNFKRFNDKYPQWMIDRDKARSAAQATGEEHIRAAAARASRTPLERKREATIPVARTRQLTPEARDALARNRTMQARARLAAGSSLLAGKKPAAAQRAYSREAPGYAPPEHILPSRSGPAGPPALAGISRARAEAAMPDPDPRTDPALAALAAPGADRDALQKYIAAQVGIQVAEQMKQVTAKQAGDLKAAMAEMHKQQQETIALIRKGQQEGNEDDATDLRKHTVMNTLFAIGGVGAAAAGIMTGTGPIMAALVAGIVPLVQVIHDYARNLG